MKSTKKLVTIGTAVATSLTIGGAVAESNPFAMTEMSSGYMQVAEAKMDEMKCGST
jgi:uncharacterized low-complexity protein